MSHTSASVFGQIDQMVETNTRSGIAEFALPASVISHFERAGIREEEVDRIIGPRRQLTKLVKKNADLTHEQTDRASRLAHIVSLSEKVFGRREKAFLWLRLPNELLGGKQPLEMISREPGARLVEEILMQIEYGVYA